MAIWPLAMEFTNIERSADVPGRERAAAIADLEKRALQQNAVAELSQHALEGRDLATLLDDAVALVPQILDVKFCKVLELMPDGQNLWLRAGAGWKPGFVGKATEPAGAESHAGFTLLSHAPVIVENIQSETRFHAPRLLLEHGVVSGMSVIIHGRGRPYGVVGAHTDQQREFSSDEVHFLQSIANVLAAAIERQQLEQELLETSAREQQRIGQDLHDGLCQRLAGIKFVTELVAYDLPEGSEAKGKIAKVAEEIRETIVQTRMLARGLLPVQLEANGLMSALEELAANTEHVFKIVCRLTCERPVLIHDNAVATHVYRIAQEAIHNAIKHGQAKQVMISLTRLDGHASLTITDDGCGLSPKASSSQGMGLHIMSYRAGMIGASLSIKSVESKGASISCEWKI